MTLVIGRQFFNRLVILSDTMISDEASTGTNIIPGRLKSIVLSQDIAVSFSGLANQACGTIRRLYGDVLNGLNLPSILESLRNSTQMFMIKGLTCLYILATTTVIVWTNVPFDILTQIAGFLIANFTIALIMVAALYLNFVLPAAYRTHPLILGGAVGSSLILLASAFVSGWGLFQKLTGG